MNKFPLSTPTSWLSGSAVPRIDVFSGDLDGETHIHSAHGALNWIADTLLRKSAVSRVCNVLRCQIGIDQASEQQAVINFPCRAAEERLRRAGRRTPGGRWAHPYSTAELRFRSCVQEVKRHRSSHDKFPSMSTEP